MSIAIVGAGLAGLSCAQALHHAGLTVELFDKGRGPGGRLSGRRHEAGAIDHGAQFFTVRDPLFQEQVTRWQLDGVVQPWAGRFARWEQQGIVADNQVQRYLGVPRMNACVRHLAAGFNVHWAARVEHLQRRRDGWWLQVSQGDDHGPYDWVVVAIPPEQAAPLVAEFSPDLGQYASSHVSDPCWAIMLWCADEVATDWDALSIPDSASASQPLSWLAWEQRKPQRGGSPRLIAHAQASWSGQHSEWSSEAVTGALTPAVTQIIGQDLAVTASQAHRWRFAKAREPSQLESMQAGCGIDVGQQLILAGDWCYGARIEAAWLSGLAAAHTMLGAR